MLPLALLAPAVVANSSLSLPIPAGYKDASAEVVAARPELKDQEIIQLAGMRDGAVVASINLVPSKPVPGRLDDARECAAFADELREKNDAKSRAWTIVDAPIGKSCQITIVRKDGHTTVHTLLRGLKNADWTMTCLFTTGDRASDDVCRRTVKTIKFRASSK